MSHRKISNALLIMMTMFAIAGLSACTSKPDSNTQIPSVNLSESQLAKYEASCKACHEVEGAGAPLRGDTEAWSAILIQPIDDIINKVVNGYQGMPPLGQCFDCDQQDLESLVYYLATPKN
ncbi:hypothetical protein A3742_27970 [Oleiphilus sp. HI0071]|jgi:cytochrome c5|uniref:c-type cytochrome n=1 Tax=unclassified Oleiphilus TaxID=2631174 RepID=UPI0007C3604F|nr:MULTISPECIES: c-type cytochrome [unclassified Oleiphilus]KZY72493.1 hypothetical protein A3737_10270 [Oleiphilus sp. HI0065]KZY83666.1 hypothetical protein A3742_06180 [Oleiphilus sp. HI0071]KZY89062.1 hypothetical protein A3744_23625 [Oleiphilus sp. HI0073]KZZ44924.1 hypothetical protein A3758_02990 [Oleiphilus sp. HI0118]KZZ50155.1 hypothetical protein A3760_20555 [Oleiphilus sp. HI0122]KZZ76444.1 hypothetical protein A3767_20800 [Oleiphilus sp. HI0133]